MLPSIISSSLTLTESNIYSLPLNSLPLKRMNDHLTKEEYIIIINRMIIYLKRIEQELIDYSVFHSATSYINRSSYSTSISISFSIGSISVVLV